MGHAPTNSQVQNSPISPPGGIKIGEIRVKTVRIFSKKIFTRLTQNIGTQALPVDIKM